MAYRLKDVEYLNTNCKILLQNENGPCPLLAAANALLLKGVIKLPSECIRSGIASIDDVINLLADRALHTHKEEYTHHINELMDIFPSLQYGMDVNPKFTNGVTGVEYTSNLIAFDLINIELVHGWLLDPQEQSITLKDLLKDKTYNQLIELVVSGNDAKCQIELLEKQIQQKQEEEEAKQIIDTPTKEQHDEKSSEGDEFVIVETEILQEPELITATEEEQEEKKDNNSDSNILINTNDASTTNTTTTSSPPKTSSKSIDELRKDHHDLSHVATTGTLINNFLSSTSHQLTHYGLSELYSFVKEKQLCVFFRNNHFSTLTKHDGVLYLLVTDLGYATVPEVVWEKLDGIDGNTEYVNHLFVKPAPRKEGDYLLESNNQKSELTPKQLLAQRSQSEADYQLALHLNGNKGTDNLDEQEGKLMAAATEASLKEYHNNNNKAVTNGTLATIPPSSTLAANNNNEEEIRKLSTLGPTVVGIPVGDAPSPSSSLNDNNGNNNNNTMQDSSNNAAHNHQSSQLQEESDRAIALQMQSQMQSQDDESLRLARKLQDEENKRAATSSSSRRSNNNNNNNRSSTRTSTTGADKSSSSSCIIS